MYPPVRQLDTIRREARRPSTHATLKPVRIFRFTLRPLVRRQTVPCTNC